MSTASIGKCTADLYDGAYGRTLRLFIPSEQQLISFREALHGLSGSRPFAFTLEDDDRFVLSGVTSVRLALSLGEEREKTVFVNEKKDLLCVEWQATSSQWSMCAAMLEGFIPDKAAHQYLSKEKIDDALIEVSYLGG